MAEFNTVFFEKSRIVDCTNLDSRSLLQFTNDCSTSIENFVLASSNDKKFVVVVGGGMSAEREVSFMSSNGIVRSLLELGHLVVFVDMGADFSNVIMQLKPDVVFNALHGTYGEDGCVPGLLNIMRVPYTGCGVLASSIAFNKKKSHQIFLANNIKVAAAKFIKKSDNIKADPLPRPYVIKPLCQGSSVGVKLVFEGDDFSFADYDFAYGKEVIVEEYVKGREIQVAVLNGRAIGALEIKLLKGKLFYDYETKYTEGFAEHVLPASLAADSYARVLKIAEHACEIFDCSGMVRVEFIYDEVADDFYMLEVNTHPGMTPLSICPEIATLENITYTQLVNQILQNATFEE
jgi:D-alanine-D-alanine ligase